MSRPPILITGLEATPIFGVRRHPRTAVEELPARERFRGGQVPDLTVGLVALAQGRERAGHVLEVVERMRLVERAEPAHPPVAQQRPHDVLADGRGDAPGAVVVGGAPDRDPQSAVGVRARSALAMSIRTRPFFPCARCGESSVIGPSGGPYTYRLSANTSFAPTTAAPARMASVIGPNSSAHFV